MDEELNSLLPYVFKPIETKTNLLGVCVTFPDTFAHSPYRI